MQPVSNYKEIKYKGQRVFEKFVMTANFKRIPKHFTADEACFLHLTDGSFQFRTPTNVLTYTKNEAMLSKCGDYFIENISLNTSKKKLSKRWMPGKVQ